MVMSNLALSITAKKIFGSKEFQSGEPVVLDFSGIESMSRTFAHEYLQCKKRKTCDISEINVPEHAQKMFDIVNNSTPRKEPIDDIKPVIVNL